MAKVGKMEFPYTAKGYKAAAKQKKAKAGMQMMNGKLMKKL
jgi:hypothetical protein